MLEYTWFQLSGHMPEVPRPFYVGRGLAYSPRCDSRTNPQDDMPDHFVLKISLSEGGVVGAAPTTRAEPMWRGMGVLREMGDKTVWDAFDPRHAGRAWEYVGIIFAGAAAAETARGIVARHGHTFRFDPAGLLVKRLLSLAREPTHTRRMTAAEGMQLVQDVMLQLAVAGEQKAHVSPRPRLAESVERLIHLELHQNHSVGELADRHDVSREHLTRVFTQEYGVSPRVYAQQIKVREACRRLRQTDDSIKQVMQALGFTSRASFSRAFRAVTGSTPSDYRRQRSGRRPPF